MNLINDPITTNSNIGWIPLITQNYMEMKELPDNIFLSNRNGVLTNESIKLDQGLNWNLSVPFTGGLYIGQLYPAGNSLYRINMSIDADKGTPDISLKFGDLIFLNVKRSISNYKITLYYYNETGSLRSDRNYTVETSYADIFIEYFSNGTAHVYDSNDSTNKSLWSQMHLDWKYPYAYLSPTLIEASVWESTSNSIEVRFYSFEQKIPQKLITILPENNTFPFGFDGPRKNYTFGAKWLINHGQRATIWADIGILSNETLKNETKDQLDNHGFELGIHFSKRLSPLSGDDAKSMITSEMNQLENTFNVTPLSWCSLQNNDNSTHAEYMWNNYKSLWRNSPNSIRAIPNVGNIYSDVMYFWKNASLHSSFIPAFSHSVSDPPEGYSLSKSDFERIMNNYVERGVKIVPYAEWYYSNMNTIENISDIYFNESEGHFSINTHGYNAKILIQDHYTDGVWFSDGYGNVKTMVDNSNYTHLEILTNKSERISKLPMLVKTQTSAYITINEYSIDGINFNVETTKGKNSVITLCNLNPGNKYQVKKDNDIIFENIINDTGCMDFEAIEENKNNNINIESKNYTQIFKEMKYMLKPNVDPTPKEWFPKSTFMLLSGILLIALYLSIVLYFKTRAKSR